MIDIIYKHNKCNLFDYCIFNLEAFYNSSQYIPIEVKKKYQIILSFLQISGLVRF